MGPDEIIQGMPRWKAFGFDTRQQYVNVYGDNAPAATPATATPAPGLTAEQGSAKAVLSRALSDFGLGALAEWAWSTYLNVGNVDQVMLEIRDRPEYKTRFAGMAALQQKGRAITESQYLDLERTYSQLYRAAGLPASFYDGPDDFASLIGGEVAPTELRDRLQMATTAAYQAPAEVRQELSRLYGINEGALTAYYLDPNRALPLLQQQFAAGTLAATSTRTGYGQLSREEAERLASLGLTEDAATRGFGELARSSELFGALPGEGGTDISRNEQLGVLEGNAGAIQRLNRRAASRKAQFEGGGGYVTSQRGATGLASAAS